ncbi:hypothetical protein [Devosia aurantiaca]|uniref:HEPN domain-containing protein n=1 Tax=Devosia aurantiaca TaxID=2714858 RepID=A0A6M1S951_9HYPH|nr:hypothetical protein [Devosia aurantiaca]NGP16539.1 hypothetical protein [Devosia aurantiaca]
MIPESAGATPYGIFLLADDYLSAASAVMDHARIGPAPVRLLAFHAAELFLKTYMRSAGQTIEALRSLGHDLEAMIEGAQSLGLILPPQVLAQSRKLTRKNDYVRVRYVVVDNRDDISEESVIRFCNTIRNSVVRALNLDEFGAPKGNHWLGALPSDYPSKNDEEVSWVQP